MYSVHAGLQINHYLKMTGAGGRTSSRENDETFTSFLLAFPIHASFHCLFPRDPCLRTVGSSLSFQEEERGLSSLPSPYCALAVASFLSWSRNQDTPLSMPSLKV